MSWAKDRSNKLSRLSLIWSIGCRRRQARLYIGWSNAFCGNMVTHPTSRRRTTQEGWLLRKNVVLTVGSGRGSERIGFHWWSLPMRGSLAYDSCHGGLRLPRSFVRV